MTKRSGGRGQEEGDPTSLGDPTKAMLSSIIVEDYIHSPLLSKLGCMLEHVAAVKMLLTVCRMCHQLLFWKCHCNSWRCFVSVAVAGAHEVGRENIGWEQNG